MTKPGPKRAFTPDQSELNNLYQQMSMRQIADYYGVGETVIHKRIHEYGITLKGESDGHRSKKGKTFTDTHRQNLSKALQGKLTGKANPNWKGGNADKVCEWCGDSFQTRNGSQAKYCSNKCRGKGRILTLHKQENPNWKGGKVRARPNTVAHKNWKKLSLERANGKCEECGVQGNNVCGCCGQKVDLHVHHIKAWKTHPSLRYDLSNAKVLCTSCHRKAHQSPM